jgi:Fe-S-cluster containining protein
MTDQEKQTICKKCQACCKVIGFVCSNAIMEFMFHWGYEIKPLDDNEFVAMLNHPCQHITESGCDIYEQRPSFCREYFAYDDPALSHLCKLPKEAQ